MKLIYQGPSLIDGEEIVVLASGVNTPSKNAKTGPMIQTYIMRADQNPNEAVKTGDDYSICGNCIHRGLNGAKRTCYVLVHQGPNMIWKKYLRLKDNLTPLTDDELVELGRGRSIRLGAYGDPLAAPTAKWAHLLQEADGHTGYSHLWETGDQAMSKWCMASVDSDAEMIKAQAAGWRTYRVVTDLALRTEHEALCPASTESECKAPINCDQCRACNGNSKGHNGSIIVQVHGAQWKKNAFASIAVQ